MTSRSQKTCQELHKYVNSCKLRDFAASSASQVNKHASWAHTSCLLSTRSTCASFKTGKASSPRRRGRKHLHCAFQKTVCSLVRSGGERTKGWERGKNTHTHPNSKLCRLRFLLGCTVRVMYWKSLLHRAGASLWLFLFGNWFSCFSYHLLRPWSYREETSSRGQLEKTWNFDHLTICEYNSWPHVWKDN